MGEHGRGSASLLQLGEWHNHYLINTTGSCLPYPSCPASLFAWAAVCATLLPPCAPTLLHPLPYPQHAHAHAEFHSLTVGSFR